MMTKRFSMLIALCVATVVGLLGGCSSKPAGTAPAGKPTTGATSPKVDYAGDKHDDGKAHGQAAAHDPDDVPITEKDIEMPKDYAALVAQVEKLANDIRDKIAAGTPTKAHRSLDELDIILKKAAEIASRSVAKEHWKEVNVQSKELAAAHNELHEKIDEKQNPDYAAVAERIQKAVESLKAVPTN